MLFRSQKHYFLLPHPDIVYHAAAHKHVPLMEDSPNEAIKNNVFGTLNVARAADKYNAQKFILISTDKAVNKTNVIDNYSLILIEYYKHYFHKYLQLLIVLVYLQQFDGIIHYRLIRPHLLP